MRLIPHLLIDQSNVLNTYLVMPKWRCWFCTALSVWAIFNTCGLVAITVRLVNWGCPMFTFNNGSHGNFNWNAPQRIAQLVISSGSYIYPQKGSQGLPPTKQPAKPTHTFKRPGAVAPAGSVRSPQRQLVIPAAPRLLPWRRQRILQWHNLLGMEPFCWPIVLSRLIMLHNSFWSGRPAAYPP